MSAFAISQDTIEDNGVTLDSNMARWIEVAPAMMSSIDVNGRLMAVSDIWLKKLGYARDEVIGRQATDFMTSESRRRAIAEVFPEFFRRGRCENIDYQMLCKDGRIIDVLLSATLARSAAEQGYSSLAIIVDVTAMKCAERWRIDSEALHRGLVGDQSELVSLITPLGDSRYVNQTFAENTSDTIAFWPMPPDRVGYVSPAIRSLLGYEPVEIAEMALSAFVHPEDIAVLRACLASLSNENRQAANVHRARHKNGSWVWVEIALTFVGEGSEAAAGIIGALRDVSQRQRQAEALRQARDAAETASRIKTDFLANMSHELRTPLAGILGVHDILHADATLSERQRRLVKLAQQSGRTLLNVVNDILDYSKMEAGKLELASVRFSTADLIGSSVSIIAGLAAEKHLDVQVSSDEDIPPYFMGDEDRLRQILLNFLNNAVKFTRAGRVALKIERLGASDGGERLRFSVSDTGMGIPKDKIDRLFQRFSQVDGSTSREYGGSGLGLAIVKRLVDLMHGDLGVESVPGEGSTFWFAVTLPVAGDESATPVIAPAVEPPARSARILVAEDIEINQVVVRGMLESAGHKVEMASNGAEAILAASTREYDIVLMDIQMPGIDGVLAATRIRAIPGPAGRLPIIAMTADVLAPKMAQFLAAGMDDHIGKPFSREELLAAVARRLPLAGASELSAARDHDATNAEGQSAALKVGCTQTAMVDNPSLDRLVKLIGQQKVESLLGKLAAQLRGRFADDAETAGDLATLSREAHKLASSAGMLGFVELSERCANLEAALNAHKNVAAPLAEARKACLDALAEISTRLDACAPIAASM